MPEVSRFCGFVIRMFIDDLQPSHFHAVEERRFVKRFVCICDVGA
jgi:hypothetical protein